MMAMILAASSRGRPSGVAPGASARRSPRSKPVPIARAVIEVDMTARARMPGTRKSTGCLVPVGSTWTPQKKSRKTTGMPRVRKRVSPLVKIMVTSARSWAASGVTGARPRSARRRPGRRGPVPAGAGPGPVRRPSALRVEASGRGAGDGQVGLLQGLAGAQIAEGQVPLGQPPGQGGDDRGGGGPGRRAQPVGARAFLVEDGAPRSCR